MNSKLIKIVSIALIAALVFSPAGVCAQTLGPSPSYYMQNDTVDSILTSERAYADYFLGMGDIIDVHMLVGDNSLALDYTFEIASNGAIFFPNIGQIKLSGLKIKEAQEYIKKEVRKKFLEGFTLTVVLKQPRLTRVYLSQDEFIQSLANLNKFVYVYGEVSRAGRYTYFVNKRLSDYINLAGGPSSAANLAYVTVTRNENGSSRNYNINASDILFKANHTYDMVIQEGDVISVPKNWFYFSDFASFASLIMLTLTFYATVTRYVR
ncbi:MAG: polysaccharide biosynthesis/export family protein [Candidatus Margulisiibacteriota bacterium]